MTPAVWMIAALALVADPRCSTELDTGLPDRVETAAGEQDLVFDHAHAAWSRVLERHVQGDRFDYKALGEASGPLDEYLLQLRGVQADQFASWTREQRYAFWINAYNAFTVHLVLSRYPVKSIKDIGTVVAPVWKKEFIPLGHLIGESEAEKISLDTIEHAILRPKFEDARVHAAINCASESCPPLRTEAFQAEKLDRQLDQQVRAWLADARYNRFERAKGRVQISELFSWFSEDFVRDAGSVRDWVARFAPEDEVAWLKAQAKVEIDHLPHSWKLNDVERKTR